MNKEPRPHQQEALIKLRQSLATGHKRPILQAPTGAGKTILAAMIIEGALKKEKRVVFVVPRLSLIDQTVKAFYDEGISEVGVIQASHHLTDFEKPVQVASIQTLMRRHYPEADLVICDEVHMDFKGIREWMAHPDWQKVPFIGLSATPWTKGLGKHWDDLIIVETVEGLITKGFLSPFRVFAPAHPDLSSVTTVAGDYHEGQLAAVMEDGNLIAGIVKTWLEKADNEPTLCFAVNCAHAKKLQKEFEISGVRCGYQDAYTEDLERVLIKERFEKGEYSVVCSVGTLTTGVDWDVRCIILARPTKSKMLFVQMVGRGLRTAPGKQICTILDHADNTLRMGFVTDIHYNTLNTGKKSESVSEKKEKKEPLPKECPKCTRLKPARVHVCPQCGFKPEIQSLIQEVEGDLVEVKGRTKKQYTPEDKQRWYSGFIYIQQQRGYSPKWPVALFKEKFGEWPNRLHDRAIAPIFDCESYVRSRMIRYAKGRQKGAA